MASAAPHVFDARQHPASTGSGYARFVSARGEPVLTRVSALGRPTLCGPDAASRDLSRC
jgi:hypothetical protein